MPRYIDAEKAVARFEACLWGKDYDRVLAKSCIDDTPTADVVEVVRCKDCKWYCLWPRYGFMICDMWMGNQPNEDDFCSRGERREDADN